MNNITYHICSDKALCGILRTGIKDINQAWTILTELQKKWPDAMIQEVEETPRGGHIYHVIEIKIKRTPYQKYMAKYYAKTKTAN